MPIRTYYLDSLAHASYLVWDDATREAALVDPQRDVERYLADASALGLAIRHCILTHLHADFVAGHLEIAALAGASLRLGPKAEVEYDERPFGEADEIRLGPSVVLRALETPGHTPESISVLVFDATTPSGAAAPHAVLTGDTLFVGDVGRPDLRVALGWKAETLANMLFDSLHGKLLRLPDATLVMPAHGAGSACGKALSAERSSTIGGERRMNYALQAKTKEEFAALVMADQPAAPAYFTFDAVYNTKRRPTLQGVLIGAARRLAWEEALALQVEGATILDARDADTFARGHAPGSVNIGLDGNFETWVGSVLDPRAKFVIVASPGREREAATRLGRIGFDGIVGTLPASALEGRRDLARMERIDEGRFWEEVGAAQAASAASAAKAGMAGMAGTAGCAGVAGTPSSLLCVLDVRGPGERKAGFVPGSIHIPLGQLPARAGEIPESGRLLVHCAGGYRSAVAASLLLARGREAADVAGGVDVPPCASGAADPACVAGGAVVAACGREKPAGA